MLVLCVADWKQQPSRRRSAKTERFSVNIWMAWSACDVMSQHSMWYLWPRRILALETCWNKRKNGWVSADKKSEIKKNQHIPTVLLLIIFRFTSEWKWMQSCRNIFKSAEGKRNIVWDHAGHFSVVTDFSPLHVVRLRNPVLVIPSPPHLSRFPTIPSLVLFHKHFPQLYNR